VPKDANASEAACLTCRHPLRVEIDALLDEGRGARYVLTRLATSHPGRDTPSRLSIGRHADHYLARRQAVNRLAVELMTTPAPKVTLTGTPIDDFLQVAGTVIDRVEQSVARLQRLGAAAETAANPDYKAAIAAEAQIIGTIRLLTEIHQAELERQARTTVSLLQSPEWSRFSKRLLEALAPFPEARLAAAQALREHAARDAVARAVGPGRPIGEEPSSDTEDPGEASS
jgi:hypothetical protein